MGFDYAAKIQGLLANANDESLEEKTRDNYRAMAEKLMDKYRIAEEEALAVDATSVEPIIHKIRLNTGYSPMAHWYMSTFNTIAWHTGVRCVTIWDNGYVANVVGYEGDVRYCEFLWTAALMMFSTRIDPSWDENLPENENIYRLRNAGIERKVIANRAWGNGDIAAARSKVQRIYLKECTSRGEAARAAGLSHNTQVYRESYARSFRDTLTHRLQDARDAADSVRGGLVLHGRTERVDEAFYKLFPYMRPTPAEAVPVVTEPCPRCAAAKSGRCREHKAAVWRASDERRYQRYNNSPSARAGVESGQAAAEDVLITRGHEKAQRLDRSGNAIEA